MRKNLNSELLNCERCGNLFVKVSRKICPDCIKKEEADFKIVQEYLAKNPNSNVEEIVLATEVDQAIILQFIRDKRLILKNSRIEGKCATCGRPVPFGNKLCVQCRNRMLADLPKKTAEEEEKEEDSNQKKLQPKEFRHLYIKDKYKR